MQQFLIKAQVSEEHLTLLAQETGFTGLEIKTDKEGLPIPVKVPKLDKDGNQVSDESSNVLLTEKRDDDGQVVYENIDITADEHICRSVKEHIMNIVRTATSSLEKKYGTSNYNKKEMDKTFNSLISVEKYDESN